jgi:hypothetical protein
LGGMCSGWGRGRCFGDDREPSFVGRYGGQAGQATLGRGMPQGLDGEGTWNVEAVTETVTPRWEGHGFAETGRFFA